jgi:hypothetical protein
MQSYFKPSLEGDSVIKFCDSGFVHRTTSLCQNSSNLSIILEVSHIREALRGEYTTRESHDSLEC